jgi:HSP20 family molecular chaperone IbpA
LPAGYDMTKAKAGYQNGFLRIDVPLLKGADWNSLDQGH